MPWVKDEMTSKFSPRTFHGSVKICKKRRRDQIQLIKECKQKKEEVVHKFWQPGGLSRLNMKEMKTVNQYYDDLNMNNITNVSSKRLRYEKGVLRLELARRCRECERFLKRMWFCVNNAQTSPTNRPFAVKREGREHWEPFGRKGVLSSQVLQLIAHILHPSKNYLRVMDDKVSLPNARVEKMGEVCSYKWVMNTALGDVIEESPIEMKFTTPEVCALALIVAMHNCDLVTIEQFLF